MELLFDIFEPTPPKRTKTGAKTASYEEINIRKRRLEWNISPSSIKEPRRPGQVAVNSISQEISLAAGANPSFFPYVRFGINKAPWAPSILEHEQATDHFVGKMRAYRSTQPMGVQQYCLYRLRFIMAASTDGAFERFGWGLCAI